MLVQPGIWLALSESGLASFVNTRVTLYFANWNREYDASYVDDKGYYNTYTYVDNLALACGRRILDHAADSTGKGCESRKPGNSTALSQRSSS